jgi:cellulose synthase/poly-beta-1,6-N-acetylglucosamine synthase-like glycosyltransferase
MNPVTETIYLIIQLAILVPLGLSSLYLFFFAGAGIFYRQPRYPVAGRHRRIAVLIPGYREDAVIVDSAADALLQDYPREQYDVIVIADSFLPQTLNRLRNLPVRVIEVSFDKSTKVRALNRAMEQLGHDYELAVILDADNLMAKDFLGKVNSFFESDHIAVQGHRTAKNLDSSLAVLDAASEEINNHIFRKGHRAVGLSSAIIGSGMAFRYGYFKDLMATVTAVGGFDKEIELKMLRQKNRIGYLDDALVYDEKVSKPETFTRQRRRWLSAQFSYFRKDFPAALRELVFRGNIDYFDKAIQFIQPPRILLLGTLVVLGTLFSAINLYSGQPQIFTFFWIVSAALCIAALLMSVPRSFYHAGTLKALASLPQGMILMFLSLARIRGANRQFLHTEHGAGAVVKEE